MLVVRVPRPGSTDTEAAGTSASLVTLGTLTAAQKKIAAQRLQEERVALGVSAQQQLAAAAECYDGDLESSEKSRINALRCYKNPPTGKPSTAWKSFRPYVGDSRPEFAVCTLCKDAGKSNWEAEVKIGKSGSTSKVSSEWEKQCSMLRIFTVR